MRKGKSVDEYFAITLVITNCMTARGKRMEQFLLVLRRY